MAMTTGAIWRLGGIPLAAILLSLLAGLGCASEFPTDVTPAEPLMITSGMSRPPPTNGKSYTVEFLPYNTLGHRIDSAMDARCVFFSNGEIACQPQQIPLLPDGIYQQRLRYTPSHHHQSPDGALVGKSTRTKILPDRVRVQNTFITHQAVLEASSQELSFEISLIMDPSMLEEQLQDDAIIKMQLVSCSCEDEHAHVNIERRLPHLKISLQRLRAGRARLSMNLSSIARLLPSLYGHSVNLVLYGFRRERENCSQISASRLLQSKRPVTIKDAILLGRSEEPATISLRGPILNPFRQLKNPSETFTTIYRSQQRILYPLPSTSFIHGQMIRFRMQRPISHNPEYLRTRFTPEIFPEVTIEDDKPRVEVRLKNARFDVEFMVLGHLSADGYEVFFPSDEITPGLYKVTITNSDCECSIQETHGSLSIVGGQVVQPARGAAVELGLPFELQFSANDLFLFDKLYIRLVVDNVAMMVFNGNSGALPAASYSGTTKIATLIGTAEKLQAKRLNDRMMTLKLVISKLPLWIQWRNCFRLEVFGRRLRTTLEEEGSSGNKTHVKQLLAISEPFSLFQASIPTPREADRVQIDDRITLDAGRSNGTCTDADCFFGLKTGPFSIQQHQLYDLETAGEQALYAAHQYQELFPLAHLKDHHTVVDPHDGEGKESPAITFGGTHNALSITIAPPRPPKRQKIDNFERAPAAPENPAPFNGNVDAPEMSKMINTREKSAAQLKDMFSALICELTTSSELNATGKDSGRDHDGLSELSALDFESLEDLLRAPITSGAKPPKATPLNNSLSLNSIPPLSSEASSLFNDLLRFNQRNPSSLGKRSRAWEEEGGLEIGL